MSKLTRGLSLLAVLLVGLLAFASAPTARADTPTIELSVQNPSEVTYAPSSPDAPVNLVLDDGSAENAIGLTAGGSFLWLNRFTPAATDYPFTLTSVEVLFTLTGGCLLGDIIDIYVWNDPDGDPTNGANYVGGLTGQFIGLFGGFESFPMNLNISGSGDVLIGIVNRGCILAGTFPAALDQDASQGRSYIGIPASGNPPTLPTATFEVIDDLGFPGNWMIRGRGETIPTAVELGQMSGSSGSTGWLFTLAGLSLVAAGFLAARRR